MTGVRSVSVFMGVGVYCFGARSTMRLWLQGDNAVKEVRNSYIGRWASLMCQGGFFKGVAHHHMVVGHTHEDIGGVVSKLPLCSCQPWI